MCLLKIKSTNPNFSFIIYKNPKTGMQIKSIRQGFGYGFFPNDSENKYIIFFYHSYHHKIFEVFD